MVISLTKSSNKSEKNSDEDLYESGLVLIKGKLYKQAVSILSEAFSQDPGVIRRKLLAKFEIYSRAYEDEAVLAIGEVLYDDQKQDYEFLNKIGNSARRLKNYQKANDLYRKALRGNKNFKKAFYNFAASLAKVEKYDSEVQKAIEQFDGIKSYVLPDYLNDPDIVNRITKKLNREVNKQNERIQALIADKEKRLEENNTEEVKQLIHRIELEEQHSYEPTYETVCRKLRQAFKTNWKQQTIEESQINLQYNLFNLGLYALSSNDAALASECFSKLKTGNCIIENIDLLIALTLDLNKGTDEAIERMSKLLSKNQENRYLNVNLGLLYKKTGNRLLSYRYLVKATELLEMSEGLYSLTDIQNRADEYLEIDNKAKALKLYRLVTNEIPGISAWMKIGEILLHREEFVEAIMAFHEIREIDITYKPAELKLMEIHDLYSEKADRLYRKKEYVEATEYYERALELFRNTVCISKAIKAYNKLGDQESVNKYSKEIEQIERQKKEEELEKQRQVFIEKGKILMKKKDFNGAIVNFEEAFNMKPDKDVFMFLAYIFKGLKQSRRLSALMRRWRLLMEREEKSRIPEDD